MRGFCLRLLALISILVPVASANAMTSIEARDAIEKARIKDIETASLEDIQGWGSAVLQVVWQPSVNQSIKRSTLETWIAEVARAFEIKGWPCHGLKYRRNLISGRANLASNRTLSGDQINEMVSALKQCVRLRGHESSLLNTAAFGESVQVVGRYSKFGRLLCTYRRPCGNTPYGRTEIDIGNAILDTFYSLLPQPYEDPGHEIRKLAPAIESSKDLSELWRDRVWPLFEPTQISLTGECARLARSLAPSELSVQILRARKAVRNTGTCTM